MAISLADIQNTKHQAPPRMLIHGPAFVGKSTFFSGSKERNQQGAPAPIFIQTEDGLTGIEAKAFPLATSYNQVVEALNALLNEKHDYKTVVIDTADWLERLIHNHVCAIEKAETIEQACGGYGRGYLKANNYWREIIGLLDRLNKEKNCIVALICHSHLRTINDPELEPFDRWVMKLHSPKSGNGACEILAEWSDVIGFAKNKTYQKAKVSKLNQEKIFTAADMGERVLCLSNSPAYLAGNRYSLPAEVPLQWSALMAAFSNTEQPKIH